MGPARAWVVLSGCGDGVVAGVGLGGGGWWGGRPPEHVMPVEAQGLMACEGCMSSKGAGGQKHWVSRREG